MEQAAVCSGLITTLLNFQCKHKLKINKVMCLPNTVHTNVCPYPCLRHWNVCNLMSCSMILLLCNFCVTLDQDGLCQPAELFNLLTEAIKGGGEWEGRAVKHWSCTLAPSPFSTDARAGPCALRQCWARRKVLMVLNALSAALSPPFLACGLDGIFIQHCLGVRRCWVSSTAKALWF